MRFLRTQTIWRYHWRIGRENVTCNFWFRNSRTIIKKLMNFPEYSGKGNASSATTSRTLWLYKERFHRSDCILISVTKFKQSCCWLPVCNLMDLCHIGIFAVINCFFYAGRTFFLCEFRRRKPLKFVKFWISINYCKQ